MADPVSVCNLAEALAGQEIEASIFLPFAIRCLQTDDPHATQARVSVRILREDRAEQQETLMIRWSAGSIPNRPLAVQSYVITEWGAIGVACAVLHALGGGLRLTSVAHEGDRFDYWVGNNDQE